jgi:hypothetical protein
MYITEREMQCSQILRLFPTPTLGGGAFFALLRLVLHTQAGSPIDRSLAFVQGRLDYIVRVNRVRRRCMLILISSVSIFLPFSHSPRPGCEPHIEPIPPHTPAQVQCFVGVEYLHFLVLCCIRGCARTRVLLLPLRSTTNSNLISIMSSSGTVNANSISIASGRFSNVVSPAPPMHPLRRASMHTQHSATSSASASASPRSHSLAVLYGASTRR